MKRIIVICLLLATVQNFAQETTGILKGKIKDQHNTPIALAHIEVVQENTGNIFHTTSQENGFFLFNQLPPDTNYRIKISYIGFYDFMQDDLTILLGQSVTLDVQLIEKTETLNEIVVTGSVGQKKGNEQKLKMELLNNLPSLNRSIQDATRLLPDANLNSFGGANYRFNNLSIDGSATNDVLGFQEPSSGAAGSVASGTPGGLAGTQPIGFGAISALSIKTAPFDVTLGNFTGASINAVTKYGKNKTEGNAYDFTKNRWITGRYADGVKQPESSFFDNQIGASIGGPVLKDKLFYFFNAEFSYRKEPVLNAPGSTNSNISLTTVNSIRDKLISQYNYDPGAFQNVDLERKSTKLFLRFDYSISNKHKLTLRNNFVTAYADNLEWTAKVFNFGNQGYRHNSTTNSLVGELKSNFNSNWNNKLIVSYSTVNDDRTYDGRVFPHLEIIDNTSNTIFAGTYREAAVYGLNLKTTQITDNVTYIKNNHTFTLGTSTEINAIEYRFLTAFNGRWQYKSVDDFLNDKPNRVRGVYNVENNDFDFNKNNPSADYNVILSGIYFQDDIKISDKFNLMAGLRIDTQFHPGDFPISDEIKNTPEFAQYENKINSKPQFNPRVGFTYAINEKVTIKGGSGLFTGRMPFVWYAYSHYISGTKYFNIDYRPITNLPITENLSDLESLQSRPLTEINLVDNGFNLPRDWKTNLNLDLKFKNNTILSFDFNYSKVVEGLYFQSINRKETALSNFDGADNRPYYTQTGDNVKINPNFTNVFLLTNTNKGYRYNGTVSISKSNHFYTGFIGYTYGMSKDISSAVRNSHAANFEWNQALVANNPKLSFSNFDLRHKISSYHFIEMPYKQSKFKIGIIYNGKSGSPFSYVYEGDVNRDGSAKNDVFYVPNNQSEIVLQDLINSEGVLVTAQDQWNQLDAYISNDAYLKSRRGKYAERNGARTPWNHQVDAKFIFEKKLKNNRLEFSLDIFNVANLINKDFGTQYYVPNINNSGYAILDFVKIENEKPIYQFHNPNSKPWLVDTINSKWQAQLGLSFYF